jgi:Peptidase family S51
MALLLESKVYVGVSAGSMIFSRNMSNRTGGVFGEQEELRILSEMPTCPPFGLYDWYVKPHLNSLDFPGREPRAVSLLPVPVPVPVPVTRHATPAPGRSAARGGRAAPSPAAR